MTKHRIAAFIFLLIFCISQSACAWGDKEPTAIVIDEETGQPIEGAIALAQWFRWSPFEGAWFEGGGLVLRKAKETFSDRDGRINIDGFWSWEVRIVSFHPFLTVYKPGYVVWDSRRTLPRHEFRTDFDKEHRIVKLKRFDKEAQQWMQKYSYIKYPHKLQAQSFVDSCLVGQAISRYKKEDIKFYEFFIKHEMPYMKKEDKEMEEEYRKKIKNNRGGK